MFLKTLKLCIIHVTNVKTLLCIQELYYTQRFELALHLCLEDFIYNDPKAVAIIFIIKIKKLRPMEIKQLAKVTRLVSDRVSV